jgi:hypothetical protein
MYTRIADVAEVVLQGARIGVLVGESVAGHVAQLVRRRPLALFAGVHHAMRSYSRTRRHVSVGFIAFLCTKPALVSAAPGGPVLPCEEAPFPAFPVLGARPNVGVWGEDEIAAAGWDRRVALDYRRPGRSCSLCFRRSFGLAAVLTTC